MQAAEPKRWHAPGIIICSLPAVLGLAFFPWAEFPFSAPKNAIFLIGTALLAALVLLRGTTTVATQRPLKLATVAFVGVVALSALCSPWRYMTRPEMVWVAAGIVLFWSAAATLRGHSRAFLISVAVTATAIAAITILQFLWRWDWLAAFAAGGTATAGRMRMYATLGNPNFVASFLAACVPAQLALAVKRRPWFITLAISSTAIVFTGSRGGVLALAAGLGVMGVLLAKRKTQRAILAISLLLAVATTYQLRSFNPRTGGEALRGRILIWQVALARGRWHSVFGSGPGTFAYTYPARVSHTLSGATTSPERFATYERHSQNDFVEIWNECGLAGILSLLAVLGLWFRSALRRWRNDVPLATMSGAPHPADVAVGRGALHVPDFGRCGTAAAICGVAALCVAALFDFPFHRAETWALLWLWMALPLTIDTLPANAPATHVQLRRLAAATLVVSALWFGMRPLIASAYEWRGERLEAADPLSAIDYYEAAVRWDPACASAQFNLTRTLALAGNLDLAWLQSAETLRRVNEPEAWLLRSRIQQARGNHGEALQELRGAVTVFPYSQDLRDELARLETISKTSTGR